MMVCIIPGLWMLPAQAQVVDTTEVVRPPRPDISRDTLRVPPSDSLMIPADSAVVPRTVLPRIPFPEALPGTFPVDSLPARMPALDAVGILAETPASFVYDFGALGWPDGWSPYALNPSRISLTLDGRPLNDGLTGQPELELLPVAFLRPLSLKPGDLGEPVGVQSVIRAFDARRPLSEIRFRSGKSGLQSVWVSHSQNRRLGWFGQPGEWGFTLGYGGHGTNGEYDGTRLSRTRQFLTRLRFSTAYGALEITNLYNRKKIGAHAGVRPSGSIYETIYNRFSALVNNPDARREKLRNDLGATLHAPVLPGLGEPMMLQGYWIENRIKYYNAGDTLWAHARRLGYGVEQGIQAGALRLFARLDGWNESVLSASSEPGAARSFLSLKGGLLFQRDGINVKGDGGLYRQHGATFPGGVLRVDLGRGNLSAFGELTRSGVTLPWIEQYGWAGLVEIRDELPETRFLMARGGGSLSLGWLSIGAEAFVHQTNQFSDLYMASEAGTPDSLVTIVSEEAHRWAGLSATLGFRKDKKRGLFFTVTPSLNQMQNPTASAEHVRQSNSLPEWYIRAKLGVRYLLFKGDFDVDFYLQGRAWSAFQSRRLHPQTGRLVIPVTTSRFVESSGTLDAVMEIGVRTAKIFVSMENILSGTSLLIGNQLVPDYPLPEQRFRFGVFWPISG